MDLIIQRASGGSVTVTVDSNAGTISSTEAAASAAAAAASANNAASSASSASSSATAAANSATGASGSATTATIQAGIATAQAATATTQADNSATSATNSANSATASANSATTATTQAGIATTQAGNAATSATNAANSATSANTSATTATTQAGIATTQASNAQNSANSATASASSATASASSATASASAASASATSASNSATTATTQAGIATSQATTATTQAGIATTQAGISTTQAGIATTKASEASASATSAANSYDQFDDRYLGSKTTPPTVDNDGNPLLVGALYYNSVTNNMNVWTGTVWNAAYISAAGYAPLANPAFTGIVTENGSRIVVQTDIGTAPNEIPLNQYLGSMAYQDAANIAGNVGVGGSVTATSGVINANSTTDALRITQVGTGNALLVEDEANPDATPTVITGDGNVVVGNTTSLTYLTGVQPKIQVNSTGISGIGISRWNAGVATNALTFLKSRGTTIGNFTSVASGDFTGSINFYGADGTNGVISAQIAAQVDGTPGTNDMPGRLVFFTTPDGTSSTIERMRIDNSGNVGVGVTPNASALLDVQSTTKGVRMPNMTTTQKNAIASPAAGLMVFDTTLSKLCVYSGAAWETITSV